jgi:hypothetical protein
MLATEVIAALQVFGPPTGAIKTFKVEAEGERLTVFSG